MRVALLILAAMLFSVSSAAAQDYSHGRRIFLEKGDCQYCHGWAGDGAGAGQSPGGAANLRRSQLDRATLITAGLGFYMSSKAQFRVAYERQSFQGALPSISGVRSALTVNF